MKAYIPRSKDRWWGYLHENGTIQTRRFFSDRCWLSIDDAFESDFVIHVVKPFYSEDRAHASKSIEIACMAWLKKQQEK
jgi:hypothetical protein